MNNLNPQKTTQKPMKSKNIFKTFVLTSVAGLGMHSAQAAVVYTQNFDTAPGIVKAFQQQIGTGTLVSGHSALNFEEFAVQGDTGFTVNTGVLVIDSNTGGNSSVSRKRSASVWLDTSGWAVGNYSVSFEISNYVSNPNGDVEFNVFEGAGLDTGYITIRTGQNNGTGAYPYDGNTANGSPATFAKITDTGTTITGNGAVNVDFTLSEAGVAGDYLAISWTQSRGIGSAGLADTFEVDNIIIQTAAVPEPSSAVLLGVAGLTLGLRRRR